MKDSKELFSRVFTEYNFSDEQMEILHQTLFEILKDIKKVCDDHKINFILGYGSLIGAVRHKGFIPWDDDLDLLMFHSDFVRFKEAILQDFGDKYDVVEPLEGTYTNKKPKLFLKNSVYTEIVYAGLPAEYRRVFVDIFLIENVPASSFKRKIIGKIYDFAFHASSLIGDYKYPSEIILKKCETDKELKDYYSFRRRLGGIFNVFFGMKFYLRLCCKLDHTNKETGFVAIPSGFNYNCEVYPKTMFTNLIDAEFNGELFKIPADYDSYLKDMYGDYMKIPSLEDRPIHSCSEFIVNTKS